MLRSTNSQERTTAHGDGSIGPASLHLFLVPLKVWCAGVLLVMFAWLCGIEERSVASLLAIGFVCLTASLVGQSPLAMVGRGEADKLPLAMFASIALRAGSTVIGLIALVKIGLLAGPAGATGCGLWYALMLAADVWVASRHVAVNFPASNRSPERA